jgi:hypothetical protein
MATASQSIDGSRFSFRVLSELPPSQHCAARPNEFLPRQWSDYYRKMCPTAARHCLRTGSCSVASEARYLGGESIALQALSLGRRSHNILRSRIRLFGHDLLRPGGRGLDRRSHVLKRAAQFWRTRSRPMDHDLRAQRPRVRSDRGIAARHNCLEHTERARGAALAVELSGAGRFRIAASARFMKGKPPVFERAA